MQRSYLPSGADLHSVYVHPWGDLSRNRTDLGVACGGCAVIAFGNRTVCEENQKDALIGVLHPDFSLALAIESRAIAISDCR